MAKYKTFLPSHKVLLASAYPVGLRTVCFPLSTANPINAVLWLCSYTEKHTCWLKHYYAVLNWPGKLNPPTLQFLHTPPSSGTPALLAQGTLVPSSFKSLIHCFPSPRSLSPIAPKPCNIQHSTWSLSWRSGHSVPLTVTMMHTL